MILMNFKIHSNVKKKRNRKRNVNQKDVKSIKIQKKAKLLNFIIKGREKYN